jgi:hypothetical protein
VLFRVQHTLHPEIVNGLPFLRVKKIKRVRAALLECKSPFREMVTQKKLFERGQVPVHNTWILAL